MTEAVCMFIMLIYMSVEDIKRKTIPVLPLMAGGVMGVVLHVMYGRIDACSRACGMIPGAAAYLLSILTHEMIGKGDALLLMVTGVYMGFWGNLFMIWIGLILAGVGGAVAVAFFKKGRNSELPFVPFLTLACLILVISGGGLPA